MTPKRVIKEGKYCLIKKMLKNILILVEFEFPHMLVEG